MNRRRFINQTAFTTAGLGMTTILPSGIWANEISPSDTLNVGLIGCRNMGFGILEHHLSNPGIHCVALCDVDENILNERASRVREKYSQNPRLYRDFRKVLEQKDVDAVIIGTPDHWHCLITVYALQAGKDVYVEKPMANSIEECNIMVRAAAHSKQIVQVGQQQRSGFIFRKATELIRSGSIGKLRKINIWANFNYGIGPALVPDEPVPQGVDYELWLGPAPLRSFNQSRFHGSWRMFWNYGGGLVSDWGVHLLDIALWAGNITGAPEKVLVYAGNTYPEKRARETFDSMSVCYPGNDFAINFDVNAGIQQGPYDMPYGIAFIGDKATVVADRSRLQVYPEWNEEEKKFRAEEYKYTEGRESHDEHVRNFIECVKSRKTPACPPLVARAAAMHVHIPNIAGRTGDSMLIWDDTNNVFKNSEAANKLITPVYREPWVLPKI